MRVCFFGTYEQDYVSNRTLIEGLRRQGCEVRECHVPLWERERNKTGRYLRSFSLALRGLELVAAYIRLFFRYLFRTPSCDVMMVGYIGHLDMPLAWLLTRFPRRPLVFSPLISLYDTLIFDRQAFTEGSLMSRFLWRLDRWTCVSADLILLDTEAHIGYFVDTFRLPREKFVRVFVGSHGLKPAPRPPIQDNEPFRVVFLGKFTPLHGLDVMIQAAALLKEDRDIEFHFVGTGQLSEEIHAIASQLALPNVRFLEWIEYDQIPAFMARMDVCLGIFGTSPKVGRVIPGKVFLALSLAKPVITADTPAIRELLMHGESAILCPAGSPDELAKDIRRLKQECNLLDHIAAGGYRVFEERASETVIGRMAAGALESLCRKSGQDGP